MKIVTIVGARPQFIKAAAISRAIEESNHHEDYVDPIVEFGDEGLVEEVHGRREVLETSAHATFGGEDGVDNEHDRHDGKGHSDLDDEHAVVARFDACATQHFVENFVIEEVSPQGHAEQSCARVDEDAKTGEEDRPLLAHAFQCVGKTTGQRDKDEACP